MLDRWYYFGCGEGAGHYLFTPREKVYNEPHGLSRGALDGTLQPQPERELYVASFSVLGGYGACALAWWDRSVDKRPASNSTVIAPGLNWTPEALLAEAQKHFPWVFNRLPQPLRLLGQPLPPPPNNQEG